MQNRAKSNKVYQVMAVALSLGIATLLLTAFLYSLSSASTAAPDAVYPGCGVSLQACIDSSASGDTIQISSGVYTESFTLNKAVSLQGEGASSTIINAVAGQRVMTITGSTIDDSVIISGLTLANGDAVDASGGGVWVTGMAHPVFQEVIIRDNHSQWGGGGIYAEAGSPLKLIDVEILNNMTERWDGGGVHVKDHASLVGGRIENNTSGDFGGAGGGGIYAFSLTLTDTLIMSNTVQSQGFMGGEGAGIRVATGPATIVGGVIEQNRCTGMACQGGGLSFSGEFLEIRDSVIVSNTGVSGGGVWTNSDVNDEFQEFRLFNNVFRNNQASGWGGGAVINGGNLVVSNTLFVDNLAPQGSAFDRYFSRSDRITNLLVVDNVNSSGSALRFRRHSNMFSSGEGYQILHATIVGNPGNDVSAMDIFSVPVGITNTIIANFAVGINLTDTTPVFEDYNLFYSNTTNISGTVASGGNSLVGDPAFRNPVTGNFHIAPDSAAYDSGVNAGVNRDADGNLRPFGGGFDIGYDEYQSPVAIDDTYSTFLNAVLAVDHSDGILVNDTGIESGPLYAIIITQPLTGTLKPNIDGSFIYTPAVGTSGLVTFTYRADDGWMSSEIGEVKILVKQIAARLFLPVITKN